LCFPISSASKASFGCVTIKFNRCSFDVTTSENTALKLLVLLSLVAVMLLTILLLIRVVECLLLSVLPVRSVNHQRAFWLFTPMLFGAFSMKFSSFMLMGSLCLKNWGESLCRGFDHTVVRTAFERGFFVSK